MVLERFSRNGFSKIILVNFHNPNPAKCRSIATQTLLPSAPTDASPPGDEERLVMGKECLEGVMRNILRGAKNV